MSQIQITNVKAPQQLSGLPAGGAFLSPPSQQSIGLQGRSGRGGAESVSSMSMTALAGLPGHKML